jgi:hypothetical protein
MNKSYSDLASPRGRSVHELAIERLWKSRSSVATSVLLYQYRHLVLIRHLVQFEPLADADSLRSQFTHACRVFQMRHARFNRIANNLREFLVFTRTGRPLVAPINQAEVMSAVLDQYAHGRLEPWPSIDGDSLKNGSQPARSEASHKSARS